MDRIGIDKKIAPQIPMITTCHGTCLRQHILCPGISSTIIAGFQTIEKIIALRRAQKKEIVKTLNVQSSGISVISGGYNPEQFFYLPKTKNTTIALLFAGKICQAKGVPWLLKSLIRLKNLNFRLHMAGSGSETEKRQCLSLASKLKNKCVYHGPLSHEDLSKLMQQCHIFVLPSFFEGVPLVLTEALACGCRIVTTSPPGVKELLGPEKNDMVKMLKLPPLKTIDAPHPEDESMLEESLTNVLDQTINKVIVNPVPDLEFVRTRSAGHTWEKIFSKIHHLYLQQCR